MRRPAMRFRKADEEEFRPELTPLVDVVFQLIIFFMVSTVFVEFSQQMDIETPEVAGSLVQDQIERLTIEITRDEKIFLDGKELVLEKIPEHLRDQTKARSVLIRADKQLPYGIVMQVMQICRSAGMTDIRTTVQ
jgi:biopolymer transport protein ExbD